MDVYPAPVREIPCQPWDWYLQTAPTLAAGRICRCGTPIKNMIPQRARVGMLGLRRAGVDESPAPAAGPGRICQNTIFAHLTRAGLTL